MGRVSAVAIEEEVTAFIVKRFENETNNAESFRNLLVRTLDRVEVRKSCLRLTLRVAENPADDGERSIIDYLPGKPIWRSQSPRSTPQRSRRYQTHNC